MGLDATCECGSFGIKIGSYKSVQDLKTRWIRAECLRQQDLGNQEEADRMAAVISPNGKISYTRFRNLTCWTDGTRRFVDHSDCDGNWSSEDASAIYRALLRLKPWIKKTFDRTWFYEEDDAFYLEDLFKHCTDHREMIELW